MVTCKDFRRGTLWLAIIVIFTGGITLIAGSGMQEIPAETRWASSGHADETSEAFVHWGEFWPDDPCSVSGSCARCHSAYGFMGFLGEPLPPGVIENQVSVIECIACHNDSATALDSVVFPSGVEITGLGPEARCMQCHQGRQSTVSVNDYIAGKAPATDDTVDSSMSFRNVHYAPAGATLIGSEAMVGYQYDDKSYEHRFAHVEGIDTCIDCHDPHSLEVKKEVCADCHDPGPDMIFTVEDLHDVRLEGSATDHDGDGDATEGIYHEIHDLMDILYEALRDYARDVAGTPIAYGSGYPYFFVDPNDNGIVDSEETTGYNAWTPRSLRASFNFQYAVKDHGGYAHNGKYVIQLLIDSITDLDPVLAETLNRDDAGHFLSYSEAFRHWDEDGDVSASCAKCHSATGLPFYLETEVNIAEPLPSGFLCTTCHDSMPEFSRYSVDEVEFPSGAMLTLTIDSPLPPAQTPEDDRSNLCINCHQGRASTVTVNDAVAGFEDDEVMTGQRFINVHYFPAGATIFGSEAKGAFEYQFKLYNGRFPHVNSLDSCVDCHDTHSLEPDIDYCGMYCHFSETENIRWDTSTDYDGDGSSTEGLAHEVETMAEALYAAIQNYAATVVGTPIIYDSHTYPYFINDTNGNGVRDPEEGSRYSDFTPRLLKAVYNYQFVKKDPGAFAHNGKYTIQFIYDSMEDLGENMTNYTRPIVMNPAADCGDPTHPYPTGDLNFDCIVNLFDWSIFSTNWLIDNNPVIH